MHKPSPVKYAELAIWASFALTVVVYIFERHMGAITSAYFIGSLFVVGLCSILPYKIGQGRNWARYVYLIFTVLSCAMLFAGETEGVPKLEVLWAWAHIPVDIAIAVLLFRPESQAWFAANRA